MSAPEPSRPITVLALKRRSGVERRVLTLLRGGEVLSLRPQPRVRPRRATSAALAPSHHQEFAELRRKALGAGLSIQAADAPYVGADELALLGWIAQAQRIVVDNPVPVPKELAPVLAACAAALKEAGLRLSPLTLHLARSAC